MVDNLLKKFEKIIEPEEEESKIFNILEYNLIDILKGNMSSSSDLLNGSLIYLLFNKKDFKNNLIKFLLKDEEKISNSEFITSHGKRHSTVSNWLKDFIKKSGKEFPGNVLVSDYIVKTSNAKKMAEEERSSLYRLLLFYRNVKFFPKSLENKDSDKWEIFPVLENYSKNKKIIGIPKTIAEKNIEKMKEEATHYKDNSLEKLAVKEEIEHEKKIEELRFMATKFGEGSLEKKAIEEELKKMEHNK